MKPDAIFKKYLTASPLSAEIILLFFSAFSACSAVNYSFLFLFNRPFVWPAAVLTPDT
jgi:hypothetical protein